MKNNRIILVLVLGVILLAVIAVAAGYTQPMGEVVAKVNGENIYSTEVDKVMEQVKVYAQNIGMDIESEEGKQVLDEYRLQVVESLIEEKFIEQLAEEQNVVVADEKVTAQTNEEIATAKEQMGEEEFTKYMAETGLTEEDIKEQIYLQLLQEELYNKVVADVQISDQEVRDFYDNYKEDLEQVMVRHILFLAEEGSATAEEIEKARQKAEDIITKLDNGADFTELAKENSEEPGAEESGGLIPQYLTRNSPYVSEFLDAAFLIEEGKYSKEPVQTQYGYHVIKVEKKKETYDELKDEIKEGLLQQKQGEEFNKFYTAARETAQIENILLEKMAEQNEQESEQNTLDNSQENKE